MRPYVKELRGAEEDMTRATLNALAVQLDTHFGVLHLKEGSVTDWAWGTGKWRMCWTWFVPVANGKEHRGIKISWIGGNCLTETRGYGRRMTLQEATLPLPKTLEQLIHTQFGIS